MATFNDQPGSTAIFGNLTYAASIANYHSALVTAIPEPGGRGVGLRRGRGEAGAVAAPEDAGGRLTAGGLRAELPP